MAIIRAARPDNHYTLIRNDVLRDDRLSYRARGVLAVILTRPDNWGTSAEELARTGSEGRDAIRTALTELESAGYLLRERRQDARGRWATVAVIYDAPQSGAIQDYLPVPGSTDSQPPTTGFQASVIQPSVSQASTTTTTTKNGVPSERAAGVSGKPPAAADVIAKAVNDGTQGMINYMAVRQVAAKALKTKPPPSPDAVIAAMLRIDQDGRTITMQAVGQSLRAGGKGGIIQSAEAHWTEGGSF